MACSSIVLFATAAHSEDWPRWRGPSHNGISQETGWLDRWPADGPPIAWKASIGTGFSAVSVSSGRLYTMGNTDDNDVVFCFDAATGEEIWRHAYPSPLEPRFFEGGPTSTPTVDGDSVYTLSRQGEVFCFDAATGEVRWSKNVQRETKVPIPAWGFAGSVLVHGDLLLLTVGEAGTALDKATGKLVWTSALREAGYATPVPFKHGDRWYVILPSGKFYAAVEIETGKERWRHRWLTRFGVNAADAVIDGERVFLSSGYNRGATLLKTGGDEPVEVWSHKEMQNQFNSSVLIDGHLYGNDGDTNSEQALKCLEFATGETKWSHGGMGMASLMAADGKLIVLSEDGELLIAPATPKAFRPTARARVLSGKCWTVPVLAQGRIYCRNADGDLVCVDVRADHEQ